MATEQKNVVMDNKDKNERRPNKRRIMGTLKKEEEELIGNYQVKNRSQSLT